MADSWLRLPDESEEAYAAFLIYRDLGIIRSVLKAYRQKSGKITAKQAPGQWNKWAKDYRWRARARDYDNYLASQRQAGIDRVARSEGGEWERRRSQQVCDDYDLARQLLKQAKLIASFPLTRQETMKDGKAMIIQPVEPKHLRDASAIARDATAMVWEAIGRGLGASEDESGDDPGLAEMKEVIGRVYDGKDDPCAS